MTLASLATLRTPLAVASIPSIINAQISATDKLLALDKLELSTKEEGSKVEPPLNHFFGKDLYVREIILKAGYYITGRVHTIDHVSVLLSGVMSIWTASEGFKRVIGPYISESKAGVKRVVYTHTDCRFMTAHSIPEDSKRDPEYLKELLTFATYAEYLDSVGLCIINEKESICHSLV